jgi:hypothetical protein
VCLQDGLALRGWRDRGSCFELRVSSTLAPDAVTCLYEAEVLLLAPGAWSTHSLALFGLNIKELQVCMTVELCCRKGRWGGVGLGGVGGGGGA